MMNKYCLALFSAAILCGVAYMAQAQKPADAKPAKLLRHVVLFKFKDGTSEADLKKVTDTFGGLPGKIETIRDFEWGTDVSPEGKSQGFTHCFFVTFADEKGRDAYLPHAAHKEFVSVVGPFVDKVLVVDYWTR